jgi:hypothetical protein
MELLKKIFLAIVILLNVMVLMGQIWPEGVPPFAKTINIIFLSLSLLILISIFIKKIYAPKK